tara:strand:+ start:6052 stop:7047 length:996 start_codon:yes stop_codon:yes gene_type:complete
MHVELLQDMINVLSYAISSKGPTVEELINVLNYEFANDPYYPTGNDPVSEYPEEVKSAFGSANDGVMYDDYLRYLSGSVQRSSLDKQMENRMRITETKLRRILRRVLSEAQGDGLSDPEVAAAYEELADLGFPDNVNRSDFAVDTDMSWLEEWPYSEALDIMHNQEGSYDDFEYGDTDAERYAEQEASMRARQNRGMYESIRKTLKEHLHGYKGSYKEPYMVREIPPEAKQIEWFQDWKEEFDLTKEAIEGNYRKMTALSIDYPKMNTRNVDEDAMDLKHYHQMTATEKYVYNKNELLYLWEDIKKLWKELDEELGIEDGFASFGLGDKLF